MAVVIIAYKMLPTLPALEQMLPFRDPSTLFVFYGRESPSRHGANTDQPVFRDLFNLTMTYRRDSDIYRPYEFIEQIQDRGEHNRAGTQKTVFMCVRISKKEKANTGAIFQT